MGGYTTPPCQGNRQPIVHLFEWPWADIAKECEEYLGPKGFCGIQVSPPNEHIQGSQWWTRYQPVSYKLDSRSGSRSDFESMVKRCKAVGVNVFVDGVINHMSGLDGVGTGTAGSSYNGGSQDYPGVPISTCQDLMVLGLAQQEVLITEVVRTILGFRSPIQTSTNLFATSRTMVTLRKLGTAT